MKSCEKPDCCADKVSEIPEHLSKYVGLDPFPYDAPYLKLCFYSGFRVIETTTPDGQVTHSIKRILCKGKRCPFCYPFLHVPRIKAKLETVPLDQDSAFGTFCPDQTRLTGWGINPGATQLASGAMIGHVRVKMQELFGSDHWQYFCVSESHKRGGIHHHPLFRDLPSLDHVWSVGADKLLADGSKRGRLIDAPAGGYWATANKFFFHRAYRGRDIADTGRKIRVHWQNKRYWDYSKVSRYHALFGLGKDAPQLKKNLVSMFKKRRRSSKNRAGRQHLYQQYQREVGLVERDVPIDGCLCHPDSEHYQYRDQHSVEDEYRAILLECITQIYATETGFGDVFILPVFSPEATREYVVKEMTKVSQQTSNRPKRVPITRSTHKFFREYQEEEDENTHRQRMIKGGSLAGAVNALKKQGSVLGAETVVSRKGPGDDVPFSELSTIRKSKE